MPVTVKRDVRLEWMKKAADNGHPKAQYYTGKAYEHGLQVTANPDKAKKYYRLAA